MDLKEFWQDKKYDAWDKNCIEAIKEKLGMFFWERGGSYFLKLCWENNHKTLKDIITYTKENNDIYEDENAKDFLDALACLGEDKVKELVGELK